jgi:hypothetical protein
MNHTVRDFAAVLRALPDVDIKRPLWEFTPAERPAVIHERRRRFGWDDEEGLSVG